MYNLGTNLLWSLHISTTNLSKRLKILKKTAVYSFKSFDAKTFNPNGPTAPLLSAFFWLHNSWGSFHFWSQTSACCSWDTWKDTTTSACNYI